jgi:hypothetical protein
VKTIGVTEQTYYRWKKYGGLRMDQAKRLKELENENIRLLLAHFHQTEQDRLERAKNRLRTELLPALSNHRVATIEAAYSGDGDSGCSDGVQFRDSAGERVERASIPDRLKEPLESALYEFLPAGFETDASAQRNPLAFGPARVSRTLLNRSVLPRFGGCHLFLFPAG